MYDSSNGPVEAVAGVSFSIRRGEFVAILGPSGCGKSTLLMMCGGLESITRGTIKVDGSAMTGPRTSIGVMFQESTLLPWKTVLDNVMFPIELLHRPRKDTFGAGPRPARTWSACPGSKTTSRISCPAACANGSAICRALVYDPDILLMDEPFSARSTRSRATR